MAKVIKTTDTNKGKYQVFIDEKGQKYFKKHVFNGILREIEGYNLIKYYYNVPKLVEYDIVKKEITYEYCEDLNSQTIHHGLFGNKPFDIETITNALVLNYRDFKFLNENLAVNSFFFLGRISKLAEYLAVKKKEYEKIIICNGEELCSFNECVLSIIKDLTQNNIVPFVISQGDPTDLNISTTGTFTDFETSGYNSLVNEIAIFVGCYLVNCYYYYIKYMNSPHKFFTDTLEKYQHLVKCDYNEDANSIAVTFKNIIPQQAKKLILSYLNKVKELEIIKSNFRLGPYIAMRMITPINLNEIDDKSDKYILIALACLFEKKYTTLNDIIKLIRRF